jgi:hypothetical protein
MRHQRQQNYVGFFRMDFFTVFGEVEMTFRKLTVCLLALATIVLFAGTLLAKESRAKASDRERVTVFPMEGVNVPPGILTASDEILISSLVENGFIVADWERGLDKIGELPEGEETGLTATTRSKIAKELDCHGYVDGKMIKLGSKIRVTINLRNSNGDILQSKVMDGEKEDDLVIILERIATAFANDMSVGETLNLDNATHAETIHKTERFRPEKNFGVIIGETFSVTDAMDHYTMFAFDVRLEQRDVLVELSAGFGIHGGQDPAGHFFAGVGVAYYLTHTGISPYLGAGFGIFLGNRLNLEEDDDNENYIPAHEDSDDEEFGVGFELYPTLGIEFLRNASMRLHLEMRYGFSISPDTDLGHGPVVVAGIAF